MIFRRAAVTNPNPSSAPGARDEMRVLAEALSVYGSAMRHLGDREAARPWVADKAPSARVRLTLLLAPALAAAVAAGVMVPVYGHFRHAEERPAAALQQTPPAAAETTASADDTALMNQIDSEVSEDAPDALQPLAALTEETNNNAANAPVVEKN